MTDHHVHHHPDLGENEHHESTGHVGHAHTEHEHPSGLGGRIKSLFVPHTHDAQGSLDTELTASAQGLRVLWISLLVLGLTAAVELGITSLSGSVALLGDAVHNVADALTAFPLALAFWLGRKAATRRYTYGFGRAEDLAGIFIVAVVAASTAYAAVVSIERLIHPTAIHRVGLVAAAGLVGFIGNELVAHYRIRVGRRIGSAALVADGQHARTDGLTSLAVVAGAIGVAVGFPRADAIMGLVITLALLSVLRTTARDIFRRLMDSVDPDLADRVEQVLAGVEGVDRVDRVRIRWVGHQLQAEATIVSDGKLTLAAAHAITERAHHQLLHAVPRLTEALIHSDPGTAGTATGHELTAHHFAQGG
jgi:cation diffusion facilitator family transporter